MQASIKGPWSAREIATFFQDSLIPMRLACVGTDGYPRVVSLWFLYEEGKLFCASHSSAVLVTLLRSNDKVGFEVATNDPPYCGVRGQGNATLTQEGGARMLERLLQRYLGALDSPLAQWLLSRSKDELLISVQPRRLFSWDYRQRMAPAAG